MHVLKQPVCKIGQRVTLQLVGEAVFEIPVTILEVLDRLGAAGTVKGPTLVKGFHAGYPLVYVQIERLLPVLLREDQLVYVDLSR